MIYPVAAFITDFVIYQITSVIVNFNLQLILNEIAFASNFAYGYTFLRNVVCLSVDCLAVTPVPLLKLFDQCRCYLPGKIVGVHSKETVRHIVLDRGP